MRDAWTHVGRLWTNGEPFLAVDAALCEAWQGLSNDDYGQIIGLGPQATSIPAGAGRAVLVGGDGEVRDEGWIEVFAAAGGVVAIVQAAGADYPDVLARALGYPDEGDHAADTLKVSSGELAIISAVFDGTGPYSVPSLPAQPGPVPPVHGPPPAEAGQGLRLSATCRTYQLKVRRYTELGQGDCSARWLLIPVEPHD
jgi:hypothetical protein